jgi:hypothetical protein
VERTIQTTPEAKGSDLAAVSCTAAEACGSTDACTAVGSIDEGKVGQYAALADSWNGTSWTTQGTPSPADYVHKSSLDGVSCAFADACTAVGSYANRYGVERTLVESWNGTAWTIETSPNRGATDS